MRPYYFPFTETTGGIEGQRIGRNDNNTIDKKGQMTCRNNCYSWLRFSALVVSGLCALLYIVDFLGDYHVRSTTNTTTTTTTISSSLQHSPLLLHVVVKPTATASSPLECTRPDHDSTNEECFPLQQSPLFPVVDVPTMTAPISIESTSIPVESINPDTDDTTIKECGIWIAPSLLRPHPGFGMFTTRDIAYHESMLHQPDAVSIPVHDLRRRNNMPLVEDRRQVWSVVGNVSKLWTNVAID
jgi:hypothetical protein